MSSAPVASSSAAAKALNQQRIHDLQRTVDRSNAEKQQKEAEIQVSE